MTDWIAGTPVAVDVQRAVAFARAINDDEPAHLDGSRVPPMLSVIATYCALYPAVDAVTPPAFRDRAVHAAHDARFLAPLVPGMTLAARARAIGVQAGRTGTSITVVLEVLAGDLLVAVHYATAYVRGWVSQADGGGYAPDPPSPPAGECLAQVSIEVDADQTYRYAAAAGDPMRLHLDAGVARELGFPGIIAHGLCTMAMTGVAAARVLGRAPLTRLAVRFAAPVLPGEPLVCAFYPGAGGVAFAVRNPRDELVVKNGFATVS